MKRITFILGIVFGALSWNLATTLWEPHSAVVKARWFAGVFLILCLLLIWYSKIGKASAGK
jgi:preprotein translocase subunit SecG